MGAVPIWIMPIYRVVENFDPAVSELFDVIIVDESSQCDLLSLRVLPLAKKAVVVGDDKQTTPDRVGINQDRIAALQTQHLQKLEDSKLLNFEDSLYAISSRAFPSIIALKEHFRCVPEIIEFRNRYYNGGILPLREVSVPEIGDPLRAIYVENSISHPFKNSRVNETEAAAIAKQIGVCVQNKAYDGLTFGVVSIMSGPQSQLIQDKIREEIGDLQFERRRIRVGNPPAFQGDERNVMFISMVAHGSSYSATTQRYLQWTNVGVSRAQDQLWVFYSMDPSTLRSDDQRRLIIEYAKSHGQRDAQIDIFDKTESKFERDVLTRMLDRGYKVDPQHKVGNFRIDFVVYTASKQRLAVECDGDSFYGPDKWQADVRRQRVLERLGWRFWRIRASKYYLNPEEAMAPLWKQLDRLELEASRRSQYKLNQRIQEFEDSGEENALVQ